MFRSGLQNPSAQLATGCSGIAEEFPWAETLPVGNILSIPADHLPRGNSGDTAQMTTKKAPREDPEVYRLRKERVAVLMKEYCEDSNSVLSDKLNDAGHFVDPSTISRWFNPPEKPLKNIGTAVAPFIESAFPHLPKGYITSPLIVPDINERKSSPDGTRQTQPEPEVRDSLERKLLVAFRKFKRPQRTRIVLELADAALRTDPEEKRGSRKSDLAKRGTILNFGKRRNSV